jgi:CubicO group peptidase (beta-lactamase class C family)
MTAIKINILRLICSLLLLHFVFISSDGQINLISGVENGLLPQIQLQDSAFIRYSIEDRLKFYNIPSVSIAIINNGHLEWAKAYGYASISDDKKADTSTLYQAASLSKSINAVAIMRLIQERKLSLDEDIRHYLKTWAIPENEFTINSKITLRQLLSHTAGINVRGFQGYKNTESIPSINAILEGSPPANNEPIKAVSWAGAQVNYSGGGVMITQKILEDHIDPDYSRLIRKEILTPLKMRTSYYEQPLSTFREQSAASGHNSRKIAIDGKYYVYPELAPAGLWTTPSDFSKYIIALQKSLAGKNSNFLNKLNAETMVTPPKDSSNSALGVFALTVGSEKYFAHNGRNVGFQSVYYGSFTSGRGIVVMVNSDNAGIIPEIVNSVAVAYNWKDFYRPERRKTSFVSDSLLNEYAGQFYCKKLKRNILIRKKGAGLEMRQELEFNKGEDCFENIYFTSDHEFFVLTSGLLWEFKKTKTTDKPILIIHDGDDIYEAEKE